MAGLAVHHIGETRGPLQHMGLRVRDFLTTLGLTEKELSMRVGIDLRTARSAKEGSCGPHTFDAMSRAFGWDFIEFVMTPVVGADPITAREREIENERKEIAAREARLDRARAARRMPVAEDRSWPRLATPKNGPERAPDR